MDEMPVVGESVGARVLTHRRDHDAMGNREAAGRERIKERRHWSRGVLLARTTSISWQQLARRRQKEKRVPHCNWRASVEPVGMPNVASRMLVPTPIRFTKFVTLNASRKSSTRRSPPTRSDLVARRLIVLYE